MNNETIHEQFKRMDGLRHERIEASKTFAYYTIPAVFPRDDAGDQSRGVGMLDSIGSTVVTHFANKLVTTLFSPNRPFFRLAPAPGSKIARELAEFKAEGKTDPSKAEQAENYLRDFRAGAAAIEEQSVQYLESINYRTAAVEAAKLIVVTGDVVIRNKNDGTTPTVFNMTNYVAEKDTSGRDSTLIVRGTRAFGAFSTQEQQLIRDMAVDRPEYEPTTEVTIYTRYTLQDDGRYLLEQATDDADMEYDESDRILVTKDQMEHTHLSWNLHSGENYGRGLVEDYAGSFHMIDVLSEVIAKLAARLAGQKILVDPMSNIDVQELNSSDGNTYISGSPNGLGTEKLVDAADIQMLDALIANHKRQVSAGFLFQSGNTRDAERVTAEEIRETAQELEVAHAGVYSRFSSEWQQKAAAESVAAVDQPLPSEIEPQIVTGLSGLSRLGELANIHDWLRDLSMLNALPEEIRGVLKPVEFTEYVATQRRVEHGEFIMSNDEIAQRENARREHEVALQQQEHAARAEETMMKGMK